MDILFWFLVAVGLFCLAGAAFNWDWFYSARRSRFFVKIFGRTGARIFYAILGAAIIGYALSYGVF